MGKRGRPSRITEEMQNPDMLKYATQEEREVLELRWKSITGTPLNQDETAKVLGISISKVKKLENDFKNRVLDNNQKRSAVQDERKLFEEMVILRGDLTRMSDKIEELERRTDQLWNAMSNVKFKRGFRWLNK